MKEKERSFLANKKVFIVPLVVSFLVSSIIITWFLKDILSGLNKLVIKEVIDSLGFPLLAMFVVVMIASVVYPLMVYFKKPKTKKL